MSRRNNIGRNPYVEDGNAAMLMGMVLSFLGLFLPNSTLQHLGNMPNLFGQLSQRIEKACRFSHSFGFFGRSVRSGKLSNVLASRQGSGRKSKTAAVEEEIITEISRNDYHTLQQIADMIKEKFQIVLSLPSVSKLLKKTTSAD